MVYRATEFTENRKAQTRERLLKESKKLVSLAGFRGLSIAEAARCSAIATGTVYRYFPSKSELCVAVFEQATQREIDAVSQAGTTAHSATQRLRSSLECFIQRALQNPTLAYALIAEPVDPELEQTRLIYRAHWAESFSTLIRLGIEQGEFIPQPETLCATALVGAMAETVIIPLQQARHDANTDTTPLTQSHCQQIVAFCLRAVVKPEHIV
ncbi:MULTISPECIES: TetR/AcrR family transcriptional regulator [unclassified Ketobacter]|uniref:TetR/AcrR family transcriptional regulator n=1 Tax=unclassified Ketobacter TaxID=2639109 RepID=UPI000F242629|nr:MULTISPECIES: TetR/AcrR family transcriptional regulator [unclassified Ketobacter]RLT91710.1 MAG: TetR/AcrR family transcriptional regulator [Ketobacter sp. GenoA1]RLT92415.1 MAG: TetR/AcrR family transcriptional regulator [Ketobacter sp.]